MSNQLTQLSLAVLACSSTLLLSGCIIAPDGEDYSTATGYTQFADTPDTNESLSSILGQGIAVGMTGWDSLKGIDAQCQQKLKANFMYKDELADLGGKYTQRKVRFNICECVSDEAMKNISEEHLEKASKNPNYKRRLINKAVDNSLYACYNKVVNNWKIKP